jgi:CheY-like chemotaxis protein
VSDTGIGIPLEGRDRLFQPFVQLEDTYTRTYQGAGLGLSIVRRLVELMGGHILLESVPGEGTDVYVNLPLALPQNPPKAEPVPEEPALAGTMRILLAEDDPSNAFAVRALLEKQGHEVTVAENGLKALEFLENNGFDLILMDIQMPVMNGVDAVRAIRTSDHLGPKKDIPVVALTAYAMESEQETFLAAGMNDCLTKPVSWTELSVMLERFGKSGRA